MKPQNIFILSLVSFLVIAYSALAEISKKEREMAITYLSETKQELLNTVKSLNNDQLNFKVNEEIWSIAECIEHLAISEHLIFEWSQNAILNSADEGEIAFQDSMLIRILTDRSQKSKTIGVLEPNGKYETVSQALKDFIKQREDHIDYVKKTKDPLRTSYFDFPFGKGDAYQVILLLAAHTERHTKQIREVMSHKDFPKSK